MDLTVDIRTHTGIYIDRVGKRGTQRERHTHRQTDIEIALSLCVAKGTKNGLHFI